MYAIRSYYADCTITELYAAARRSKDVRLARVVVESARVVTPSWRIEPQQLRRFYHHPDYAPQIRALLRADPFVRLEDVERFLEANLPLG